MEKVIFEVGDQVVTIEQSQLKRGVIKDIYYLGTPILIVKFENGNVEKCVISDVAPAPVERPETESDEKEVITITLEEFSKICSDEIGRLTCRGIISLLDGTRISIVLGLICKKLFGDESNDD